MEGGGEGEGGLGGAARKAAVYALAGLAAFSGVAAPALAEDHPARTPPAYQEVLQSEGEGRLQVGGYDLHLPTKEDLLSPRGGAFARPASLEMYVEQGQYASSWERLPKDHPLRDGGLGRYHVPEEVASELYALQKKAPTIARVEVIGTSGLGNPIHAIRIGKPASNKPEVLLVGQTHAREAISVEVPLGVAKRLVEGYGKDPYVTRLVDTRDVWIVPSLNPDGGMIVAEQVRRYGDSDWRKNARDNGALVEQSPDAWYATSSSLHGVDLNRNWPVDFGGAQGASGEPWHQTYCGPSPLSEKEGQALAKLVEGHHFEGALAFHSYGGEIQYAPDHTTRPGPREELYRAVGEGMRAHQKEGYEVLRGGVAYLASGTFVDWADSKGVLAYTVELEGQGGWGNTFLEFNPDEEGIKGVVDNNVGAVLWFIDAAGDWQRAVAQQAPRADQSRPAEAHESGAAELLPWEE